MAHIADSLGVEVHELFKTNSTPNLVPIIIHNDNKKLLDRLVKVMTRKVNSAVNNAMEGVLKDFLK